MNKLLVVEEFFDIKERGLVVVPGPPVTERFPTINLDGELRHPNGTTRMTRVRIQHVFQTPPSKEPRYAVVLPQLSKGDVSIGTEVWCIIEPPTIDALRSDLETVPFLDPWRRVAGTEADSLRNELLRELTTSHPLHGRPVESVARRTDSDDALFLMDSPPALAVVHLTWNVESNAAWPHSRPFASAKHWVGEVMNVDSDA